MRRALVINFCTSMGEGWEGERKGGIETRRERREGGTKRAEEGCKPLVEVKKGGRGEIKR